jgi:2-amino-4-hydroxy-6-hydroxymethyldihydropteridine diphosphokinase
VTESVFVGVGSNIDKLDNIRAAIETLDKSFAPIRVSPVYETLAVGFDGPNFHNLVIGFKTCRTPAEIYQCLRDIESSRHRVRTGEQFVSRTLDLDLLLYGEQCMVNELFRIPHDDILRYAFVLKPLLDLSPGLKHPVLGIALRELWRSFKPDKTRDLVDVSAQYQVCS